MLLLYERQTLVVVLECRELVYTVICARLDRDRTCAWVVTCPLRTAVGSTLPVQEERLRQLAEIVSNPHFMGLCRVQGVCYGHCQSAQQRGILPWHVRHIPNMLTCDCCAHLYRMTSG